ncbi:MAG: anthranilate synthase component I [bacterium]|nr:anthranilate synthase component I [bacterium]
MITPDFATFTSLARDGTVIPVYRELLADMETPLGVYARLAGHGHSFLLESVEGGENVARYSFIGCAPRAVFTARGHHVTFRHGSQVETYNVPDSPVAELRRRMAQYRAVSLPELPRFVGGAVGYISYDVVRFFEPRVPQTKPDLLQIPELYFVFTNSVVAFDHVRRRLLVIANAFCDGRPLREIYAEACATIQILIEQLARPLPFKPVEPVNQDALRDVDQLIPPSNFTQEGFMAMVERCKEYIRAGDVIQVVPSQRFSFARPAPPYAIYRALRCINPSPYMFLLEFDGVALAGSSPEVMVRSDRHTVELRPIAGTRRRGATPEEDHALARELLADEKERAEHVMLVDLGRNDLGRVCAFNTVHVSELMVIERYSHVMHIVSHVRGTLLPGFDAFDVLAATFPAGTVTGAPKIRAMEIIDEIEPCRRGPYAGTVCYLGYDGRLDSCITIRTVVICGDRAYVQAGAGIVADSLPEREFSETVFKARGMMKALRLAEQFRTD